MNKKNTISVQSSSSLSMKIGALLTLLLMVCVPLSAQELRVKSMELLPNDATARMEDFQRQDLNGNYAGVVKVMLAVSGVKFAGGGVMEQQEFLPGEYWVWIAKDSKRIKVHAPGFLPFELNFFNDYKILIEPKCTYKLVLTGTSEQQNTISTSGNNTTPSPHIDFKAKILRNGTEDKFESDTFKSGDDFYLSFTSPISGYLAVYLVDADKQAFCLLPYRQQTNGIYPVKANQRYIFFNEEEAPKSERVLVDEYVMTCSQSVEQNQIYLIFSPNQFVKASDDNINYGLPRQLSFDEFNKWLARCMKADPSMKLEKKPIKIRKM